MTTIDLSEPCQWNDLINGSIKQARLDLCCKIILPISNLSHQSNVSWAMMHGRSMVYWLLSNLDQKYNEPC